MYPQSEISGLDKKTTWTGGTLEEREGEPKPWGKGKGRREKEGKRRSHRRTSPRRPVAADAEQPIIAGAYQRRPKPSRKKRLWLRKSRWRKE